MGAHMLMPCRDSVLTSVLLCARVRALAGGTLLML